MSKTSHEERKGQDESVIVLSIQPQVLWEEEVRICLANGFLLTTKNIQAKYIEAIYELEFNEASEQWRHHLLYHQLAARVSWQGCKNGQLAKVQTIVDAICGDSKKRASLIKECEQNVTFRQSCQREAMGRAPEAWEEARYPGIPLRRCPACLKAVPRQSVQCLQCWGHLLTEEDAVAEIKDIEKVRLTRSQRILCWKDERPMMLNVE